MGYEIKNETDWRVSRSGYEIHMGWSDNKKVICKYPHKTIPLNAEKFQEWLENAELICELHNKHNTGGKDSE